MAQIDRDRFLSMASCYDAMTPHLVPAYAFMQEVLIDELTFDSIDPMVILDLGAGSGRLIELFLKRFPESQCIWLDSSPDFLDVAKRRLANYDDRVTFLTRAFADDWESDLRFRPSAVVSSNAIHHLSNRNKRRLYLRCYRVVRKRGWFFNIDETSSPSDDAYRHHLKYWVHHVDRAKYEIPDNLRSEYDAWTKRFESWKIRNIETRGRKHEGDDIHASYTKQLRWLKQCGFKNVDVYAKRGLWTLMAGRKM